MELSEQDTRRLYRELWFALVPSEKPPETLTVDFLKSAFDTIRTQCHATVYIVGGGDQDVWQCEVRSDTVTSEKLLGADFDETRLRALAAFVRNGGLK